MKELSRRDRLVLAILPEMMKQTPNIEDAVIGAFQYADAIICKSKTKWFDNDGSTD